MNEQRSFLAQVDQESSGIRDMLDMYPAFAEDFRNGGLYRDGARLAVIDCLAVAQVDPSRLMARLRAWDIASRA